MKSLLTQIKNPTENEVHPAGLHLTKQLTHISNEHITHLELLLI